MITSTELMEFANYIGKDLPLLDPTNLLIELLVLEFIFIILLGLIEKPKDNKWINFTILLKVVSFFIMFLFMGILIIVLIILCFILIFLEELNKKINVYIIMIIFGIVIWILCNYIVAKTFGKEEKAQPVHIKAKRKTSRKKR